MVYIETNAGKSDSVGMVMGTSAFRIADTFMLRVVQTKNKAPEFVGKVSWHTPWNDSVDLVRSSVMRVDDLGDVHALLTLPGDLRMYLSATATRDMIFVLDAKDGEPQLPELLNAESVGAALEKSTVGVFRREVGSSTWVKLR